MRISSPCERGDSVISVHNDYSYVHVCIECKLDKGSATEVHRECTRDASTEWTTHVALTWCVWLDIIRERD